MQSSRCFRALLLRGNYIRRLAFIVFGIALPSFAQYQCATTTSGACTVIVSTGSDIGTEINSAIALASCPGSGCLVSVPPGNYSFSTGIVVNKPVTLHLGAGTYTATVVPTTFQVVDLTAAGAVLEGDGPATILQTTNASNGVVPLSGTTIKNLTLKGACVLSGVQCNSTQSPSQGVNSGSSIGVTITDVIIENWGTHGINTGGSSTGWRLARVTSQSNYDDGILLSGGSDYAVLEAVTTQNNGGNGIDINASYATVTNSVSTGNGYNSSNGDDCWGVLISAVAPENIDTDGNLIAGNRIFNNYCHQMIIRAEASALHANFNTITGNIISSGANTKSTAMGIVIDASVSNGGTIEGTLIGDNTVMNMPGNGILIGGGVGQGTQSYNTIRHNRLVNNGSGSVGGYGIQLSSGTYTKLDRNTFIGNISGDFNIVPSASQTYLQEQSTTFANLGTQAPGSQIWCTNCRVTTPCTSGGSGAWAFAENSTWKCPF
jgi:hypothetical protein